MVTAELIENQRWDEITRLCQKSRSIVDAARLGNAVKETHNAVLASGSQVMPGQFAEQSTDTAQKI